MKDFKHYLALMALLSIGLGVFLLYDYNRTAQKWVVVAMAAAYVLWGTVHHTLKKDFHWQILVEYLAVALMTSVVVIFLLLRA